MPRCRCPICTMVALKPLKKKLEDIVVFPAQKVFNSDFSNTSYKQEMRIAQIPFSEKPQMKIKKF